MMSHHANSKLSLNTSFLEKSKRGEELLFTPGSRKATFNTTVASPAFSTNSSSSSRSFTSSSLPQAPGNLPPFPIDSEQCPLPLERPFDKSNMYKVPGQNVYFVPFNSAPIGSHPGWTASMPSPTYPAIPESNYYPGQPRQIFEDMHGPGHQLYVVPHPDYETDPSEDDDMRHNLNVAAYPIESRPYVEKRAGFRPPLSVSPANSSATDESGRSSSYGSTTSSGSGRSVRWTDDLIAPTPPPSRPRPKGWFNRRGDQLWTNDGRYKVAAEEYPHYLRDYPDVGEGWMNEHGIRISMTHRRMPDHCARPPKGVLKNNYSPINF